LKASEFDRVRTREARQLGDGLGYLKVVMFPGMIGVEVANAISRAVEGLGKIDRLIIDLR
jgi:C-terminal processing protease CtpA/Prc